MMLKDLSTLLSRSSASIFEDALSSALIDCAQDGDESSVRRKDARRREAD